MKISKNIKIAIVVLILISIISIVWFYSSPRSESTTLSTTNQHTTLSITNQQCDLTANRIYTLDNVPKTKEGYLFLINDEGINIPGPKIPSDQVDFKLSGEKVELVNAASYASSGYKVTVNPMLSYQIAIDDFEYEIDLAKVELKSENGFINSIFTFYSNVDKQGVAHHLTIRAGVFESDPVTIEVREER